MAKNSALHGKDEDKKPVSRSVRADLQALCGVYAEHVHVENWKQIVQSEKDRNVQASGLEKGKEVEGKTSVHGWSALWRRGASRPKGVSKGLAKSWAQVAVPISKGFALSFVAPKMEDGKPVVKPAVATLGVANPIWTRCLVGYFVGKKLPFKLTEATAMGIRGSILKSVMANENGFFFFHIPELEARQHILDAGPRLFARVPLILQQWTPSLDLIKGQHHSLPLWVRLRTVPLALWSAPGLSELASAVGRPLYVDQQTEQMQQLLRWNLCNDTLFRGRIVNLHSIKQQIAKMVRDKGCTIYHMDWTPENLTCQRNWDLPMTVFD